MTSTDIFNYGFVIPNYNHHLVIESTVDTLIGFKLPILIIDDGSNQQTQSVLSIIDNKYEQVTLLRRDKNGGKGAAVQSGLKKAEQLLGSRKKIDPNVESKWMEVASMLAREKGEFARARALLANATSDLDNTPIRLLALLS